MLGDWYANVFNVGPQPLILCTSEISFLSIVLRARDLPSLPSRLCEATAVTLSTIGVPEDRVDQEIQEMSALEIGKTSSRRVLGVMTEMVFLAQSYYRPGDPDALANLSLRLSGTPVSPLWKNAQRDSFPAKAAMRLLSAV